MSTLKAEGFKNMRIKLSSFDQVAVDKATQEIFSILMQIDGRNSIIGPIHLPRRSTSVVVNRAPHGDGKAKEKFHTYVFSRLIEWCDAVASHEAITGIKVPSGVGISVKMVSGKKKN